MTGRAAIFLSLALLAGVLTYVLYPEPAAAPPTPSAQALPDRFSDREVAKVPLPTAMDFAPDGRMLVTSKPGYVYAVEDG